MKLTQKFLNQYKKADRKKKGKILDEYCRLTGVKRNTASRRFRRKIRSGFRPRIFSSKRFKKKSGKKRGPKKKYGAVCQRVIKKCWSLAGEVCGEKLHPMLEVYIEQLKKSGKLKFCCSSKITLVKKMSLGTAKNIIAEFPKTGGSKKRRGNSGIYKQVPIVANFGQYAKEKPGYTEVDFVEHNGGCSSGRFVITGSFVDLFSQWIARAAGWGKSQTSIRKIDQKAHQRIFHLIHHYHPDNNIPLLSILFERVKKERAKKEVEISRSRPYKKNDNAHVEQKNDDKVRKLVGYYRYDSKEETDLLNQLYREADYLDNFFIASAKLKEKIRNNQGRVIKRKHDTPKTPYQRLIESDQVSKKTKQQLKKFYHSLDMVKLKRRIEKILDKLFEIQQKKSAVKRKKS